MAYGDDDGFLDWLNVNGQTLPDTSPSACVLRERGSAYVDGYEPRLTGLRADPIMQEAAWPRVGALVRGSITVPDGVIPPAVVTASYRAAWLEAETPGLLTKTVAAGQRVKRQKVDAIEREFFDDGASGIGGGPAFVDPVIDAAMSAFIMPDTGSGAFLWSIGGC